ncbi:low molecular weight phosphotyrosine protein phosphatase [Stutzerimonas nosocomialis]|uniref:low molecular weight protein-tyrosine-phosphatase n=1 Tax=Stutzerimonas nosocomialis TaxID=1056496 RepID=UPI001109E03C|nr:low molecular weight protein-tyrosine-phosphatase [Stutzerimonas nosocomialis]TLX59424.1 low molecular weight phosphotyrosine protein phosphatase [Stutzerimonas nosocomialis]
MRILFVCLGNICRSPTVEAVFQHRLRQAGLDSTVVVDSAGTGGWHVGKAPDRRATAAARLRGYDLSPLRARQVSPDDFHRFDLILAMDAQNLADLQAIKPAGSAAKLDLFLRRANLQPEDVPDPYYGEDDGFAQVLDLVEQGSEVLLEDIRRLL